MSNQENFDRQIESANAALETIATSITSEAQQIREYIAANQGVDTSALDGVVERLESVAGNVAGIFEPATETELPEAETVSGDEAGETESSTNGETDETNPVTNEDSE